jgi:hypothetical protein
MARMRMLARPASAGVAVSLLIVVALVVVLLARGHGGLQHRPAAAPLRLPVLPQSLPIAATALAADIDRAQAIIDSAASTSSALSSAGRFEQLATFALERASVSGRRATLALLGSQAGATMKANLSAAASLAGLNERPRSFPDWRIVQPPPPNTLLSYFRLAQSRFGVPWEELAAMEFIETRFGRIHGLSPAGAQGPMQFMPATWARYGSGHIDNPRDAILSAARYLVANGAPGAMADALYHYNPSVDYVHAVEDYAGVMRADGRSYYGYYNWQVAYTRVSGTAFLPVGYPRVRPEPVHVP